MDLLAPPTLARDLLSVAKPGITLANLWVALAAAVAAPGAVSPPTLVWLAVGTAALVSAAAALNCALERDTDALMRRTRQRPVPAGRLQRAPVAASAALLGGASLLLLGFLVSAGVALLGAVALVTYVGPYTLLKTRTGLSTLIGTVPGALPALMGWVAATGELSPGGLLLFLTMVLWQVPHFVAIGEMVHDDYRAAGVLTLADALGRRSARLFAVACAALLAPTCAALASHGLGGEPLLLGGTLAAAGLAAVAAHGLFTGRPRRLFAACNLWLLAVLAALVVVG